jgi:hypothetical protein
MWRELQLAALALADAERTQASGVMEKRAKTAAEADAAD